jgi:hypothetical protein
VTTRSSASPAGIRDPLKARWSAFCRPRDPQGSIGHTGDFEQGPPIPQPLPGFGGPDRSTPCKPRVPAGGDAPRYPFFVAPQ